MLDLFQINYHLQMKNELSFTSSSPLLQLSSSLSLLLPSSPHPLLSSPLGRFLFTKPLGLNPNLIELNELKTRVSFFLKLDNGKYCPWISLNFRNMTSSGDVIQIKNGIFKNIIIQLVFQKCFLSLRRNTPCLFDA